MAADARATSHAIEQHVTNELQAAESFDSDITYSKGEALLRMLESYIGEEVFRAGIRSYIKNRAYSNAAAADLWNALKAASGKDIPAIAAQWIEKPGFPLVSVAAGSLALLAASSGLARASYGPPVPWPIWWVPGGFHCIVKRGERQA